MLIVQFTDFYMSKTLTLKKCDIENIMETFLECLV